MNKGRRIISGKMNKGRRLVIGKMNKAPTNSPKRNLMPTTSRRKCQESYYTPHGRHLQLASLDEGDGEGAKAVKEGLTDEEEAAMLDEGATEFGLEVADAVGYAGFTGTHHIIAGAVGFVRQLDTGIGR